MIRKLPEQKERVESGPIQFGKDWPGTFFRGDNKPPCLPNRTSPRRNYRPYIKTIPHQLLKTTAKLQNIKEPITPLTATHSRANF